jgi:hypothetical protein
MNNVKTGEKVFIQSSTIPEGVVLEDQVIIHPNYMVARSKSIHVKHYQTVNSKKEIEEINANNSKFNKQPFNVSDKYNFFEDCMNMRLFSVEPRHNVLLPEFSKRLLAAKCTAYDKILVPEISDFHNELLGKKLDENSASNFKKEVMETLYRYAQDELDISNIFFELNGLRLAGNRTFTECVRHIFRSVMEFHHPFSRSLTFTYPSDLFLLNIPSSKISKHEMILAKKIEENIDYWKNVLKNYIKEKNEQVDVLFVLEEFCNSETCSVGFRDDTKYTRLLFPVISIFLHKKEIIEKEALFIWANLAKQTIEDNKLFVQTVKTFLNMLEN